MKRVLTSTICLALMQLLLTSNAFALFIPIELGVYNASMQADYRIKPPKTYLGIEFDIPDTYLDNYIVGGNGKSLNVETNVQNPNTAYILVNTGWGVKGFHSGDIIFETDDDQRFTVALTNNYNIRNWQYDARFSNSISAPYVTQAWATYPTLWNSTGWIDLMTIDLPDSFQGHTLESIRFVDYGHSDYSMLFVKGVTVDYTPPTPVATPEPATLLLSGLGILSLCYMRARSSKARPGNGNPTPSTKTP